MTKTQSLFRSEWVQLLLLLALLLAARSTLADHYYVPSGSMEHTLQVGDRVFVDKRAYGYRIPFTNGDVISQDAVGRGEIVIFDSPQDGKRLIKRVVAIGGDVVSLVGGRLTVAFCPCLPPYPEVPIILPPHGQIAQLVEHSTENAGVGGSTPPLPTSASSCRPRV